MKQMAKLEVEIIADQKATGYMCQYGLDNARRIALSMYRRLKAETKKRKEKYGNE